MKLIYYGFPLTNRFNKDSISVFFLCIGFIDYFYLSLFDGFLISEISNL